MTELETKLYEALRQAQNIALEAQDEWDKDNDMRVGKLLKALSGGLSRYRPETDQICEALREYERIKDAG